MDSMDLEANKRRKINNEDCNSFNSNPTTPNYGKVGNSNHFDYSKDFSFTNLLERMDGDKYGSVTKEFEAMHAHRIQMMNALSSLRPSPKPTITPQGSTNVYSDNHTVIDLDDDTISDAVNPLDSLPPNGQPKENKAIVILDSDDEDASPAVGNKQSLRPADNISLLSASLASEIEKHILKASKLAQEASSYQLVQYDQGSHRPYITAAFKPIKQPSIQFEKVVLQTVDENQRLQNVVDETSVKINNEKQDLIKSKKGIDRKCSSKRKKRSEIQDADASNSIKSIVPYAELKQHNDDSEYVSAETLQEKIHNRSFNEDEKVLSESDGLEDLWKDMSLAMEFTKDDASDDQVVLEEVEEEEECGHSYLLQDDFGLVCRICGVIQKSIDTIFDYQWTKGSHSIRTYLSGQKNSKGLDEEIQFSGIKVSEDEFIDAEVSIHPRHLKQMKPHQLEGFNFLVKNLITDKPGGCILAHAPGSGKTFMLISFIQSFLAKYPSKKPMVVLPKGILPIWKKELQLWQVEDLPVIDLYSSKAENRSQQLGVLKVWQETNKSILFLGYKQFTNIVSDKENSKASAACREILLKVPGLLILDEGHTPRNEETYMLDSLAKVQTPRKVVLSGTLFQNHVREVFNILNLVRPKFLKMEHSRAIVKRVLSRVHISSGRKLSKMDNAFCELVEETLQNDDNFKRKVTVIQDLRELTKHVLHYYKGDFLEELPGLVDFTVMLNLNAKQKQMIERLPKSDKFRRTSLASAIYMHPQLYEAAEKDPGDRAASLNDYSAKFDSLLDSISFRDGIKTKFFLNILSLAESVGEKLLCFSHYLLPLKFLERLIVKTKGWHTGKEIFMISGDSSSEERERSMEQFNNSVDAKVFFGSIKACGEGISLVGASRIVILDVHLNPSVTRQAIGRAFRPGQLKKVYTYRLVGADSPEEEDHRTSFRKELISKMWFEWSEYRGLDFELDEVDPTSCDDEFLECRLVGEDIKTVYRR
ncbi:protein CHROMATIN REMODELING 35-like [Zingiber officinale]|uniref:protein CHROMATIN REMODELING 35-like n=1 Tax=Zingiber officinale TaxID=94328 RepID=UPI001C4D57B5|nr:protein CHROMATIN REMODELING 35-like [Zingiber officinale]